MDFSPYKLLILPDRLRLDKVLAGKVCAYLKAGGKVLSSLYGGMKEDEKNWDVYVSCTQDVGGQVYQPIVARAFFCRT